MVQDILNEFRDSGHISNGNLYMPLDAALSLIQRCSEVQVAILGMETFELVSGRELHPRLDLIADFSTVMDATLSWERKVRQTTADAAGFVNSVVRLAPDLLVNFVLKAGNDG